MEINYNIKEEQKNNQSEPNNKKKKSNSINKLNSKNKLDYSKKFHQNHLVSIHKLFSKDKIIQGKIPQFPLFNLNISKNNILKPKQFGNSYIYTIPKEDQVEKENIISEIFRIEDQIKEKNEELNEYKEFYKQLQENNLTFKAIIERILNIDDNETQMNNENKKEEKGKKEPKIINRLKLEIINYDKNIEKKEKVLDKTKNKKKINSFLNMNKLIDEKNRELENLVNGGQKLQYSQKEMDKKIDFYFDEIKNYREKYNKLTDKLKINEKEIKYNINEIEHKENEVVDYYVKLDKLEEELKIIEENNIDKKEKVEKITEEYNNEKEIIKEKEIIDKELENVYNKFYSIKKIIEKNNRNITRIKNENEEFEKDINILKTENNILNEKVKESQKGKQSFNIWEKNIKQMKKERDKNKLIYENVLKKEKEDKKRIQKEIEEFEKAKINLINKINELTCELREKTKENNIKEEELTKANEEYNNALKEIKSNN